MPLSADWRRAKNVSVIPSSSARNSSLPTGLSSQCTEVLQESTAHSILNFAENQLPVRCVQNIGYKQFFTRIPACIARKLIGGDRNSFPFFRSCSSASAAGSGPFISEASRMSATRNARRSGLHLPDCTGRPPKSVGRGSEAVVLDSRPMNRHVRRCAAHGNRERRGLWRTRELSRRSVCPLL